LPTSNAFGHRKEQLQAERRRSLDGPRRQLEQNRHRRLVVSAEDRVALAPVHPVVEDHLDRAVMRNRVDVGAEHQPPFAAARRPRQQVARAGRDPRARVVLLHLETQTAQLRRHRVGDCPLVVSRARDLAKANKTIEQARVVRHAQSLCGRGS
jgi:hypothetical protein